MTCQQEERMERMNHDSSTRRENGKTETYLKEVIHFPKLITLCL